jgi:hypothetical protein
MNVLIIPEDFRKDQYILLAIPTSCCRVPSCPTHEGGFRTYRPSFQWGLRLRPLRARSSRHPEAIPQPSSPNPLLPRSTMPNPRRWVSYVQTLISMGAPAGDPAGSGGPPPGSPAGRHRSSAPPLQFTPQPTIQYHDTLPDPAISPVSGGSCVPPIPRGVPISRPCCCLRPNTAPSCSSIPCRSARHRPEEVHKPRSEQHSEQAPNR